MGRVVRLLREATSDVILVAFSGCCAEVVSFMHSVRQQHSVCVAILYG